MPYTRTTLTNTRSGRSVTGKQTFRLTGMGRAKIKAVDSPEILQVSFPFGPRDIKIDNRVAKVVEIERPSRKPILAVERPSLVTLGFSATIADKQSNGANPDTVEDVLETLYEIAENGYQCKFIYGLASYPFVFRITKLTITESMKNADGQTIRANVDIQLTESAAYNPTLIDLSVVTFEPPVIPRPSGPPPEEDEVPSSFDYHSSMLDPSRANSLEGLYRGPRQQAVANLSQLVYGYASSPTWTPYNNPPPTDR